MAHSMESWLCIVLQGVGVLHCPSSTRGSAATVIRDGVPSAAAMQPALVAVPEFLSLCLLLVHREYVRRMGVKTLKQHHRLGTAAKHNSCCQTGARSGRKAMSSGHIGHCGIVDQENVRCAGDRNSLVTVGQFDSNPQLARVAGTNIRTTVRSFCVIPKM
jgi:hypothetical protein